MLSHVSYTIVTSALELRSNSFQLNCKQISALAVSVWIMKMHFVLTFALDNINLKLLLGSNVRQRKTEAVIGSNVTGTK